MGFGVWGCGFWGCGFWGLLFRVVGFGVGVTCSDRSKCTFWPAKTTAN